MPTYDVECSSCSFVDTETVKLTALAEWDLQAKCPKCEAANGTYRRVIRQAPVSFGGEKMAANSEASRKRSVQEKFVSSGEKDAMLHRNAKHHSPDKAAAARESAAKGEFEGF